MIRDDIDIVACKDFFRVACLHVVVAGERAIHDEGSRRARLEVLRNDEGPGRGRRSHPAVVHLVAGLPGEDGRVVTVTASVD